MNSVEQYIFQQNMAQLDTHWEPFAKEIMALQTPDTFTCLYATDIHYIRKYAYYAVVYSRLQEMVAFSGHIGADLLAVTGDLADGNTTLTRQYRDLYDVVSLLRQSKTTFLALSKGNHDNCGWYSYQHELGVDNLITPEQWYTHVVNPVRVQFAIRCDAANPGGGYYAMDDPFHKIRILNLCFEFITNTLILRFDLQSARTVSFFSFQTFLDSRNDFTIFVQTHFTHL